MGTINAAAVLVELGADYSMCHDMLRLQDSQFWRRTMIRTVVGMFEASQSLMAAEALKAIDGDLKSTDIHAIALLLEDAPRLRENGNVRLEPRRESLTNILAFTLKTLKERRGMNGEVLADHEWHLCKRTIEVRNRITHPKQQSDLKVSEEEIVNAVSAHGWLMKKMMALLHGKNA